MNYKQVYKKIIDWYASAKTPCVGEYDGKIGFSDGCLVYLVPKEVCPFDVNAFRSLDLDAALGKPYSDIKLMDSGLIKEYKKDKLKVFTRPDETKTYINQKYLTCFKDCEFFQDRELAPIFIYKNLDLKGVVLPVRVIEEGIYA